MSKSRSTSPIARALSLVVGLSLLAGCGTAGGPGSSAANGGGVAMNPGGGASSASGAGKVADMTDFVPVAPSDEAPPRTADGKLKVIIGLKSQASKADDQLIAGKGGTVTKTFQIVNAVAAEVPESALDALRADPRVESIEPDWPVYAAGVELDTAWGVSRVGSGGAHAAGNKGKGIKVAILDTGIDATHPDLKAGYAGGYHVFARSTNAADDHGHGTHVAGIVGARDNKVGVIGVAPEARLYAVKVLDSGGGGSSSNVMAGLQWCVTNKMQVACLSLGSTSDPGPAYENAFKAAEAAGLVIVCAAGNSGRVNYPAGYTSTIAVSNINANNRLGISSTGPRVDICAPGTSIVSCARGGKYVAMSGTSMAAPHVAGAVALALSSGCPPSEVRQRLNLCALDLGAPGRDDLYGEGMLRVPQLVGLANTPPEITITSPEKGRVYPRGTATTFTATAFDLQDGLISGNIVWTIDNATFNGATISTQLADGAHRVTARATDKDGATGASTTIDFNVGNAVPIVKITSPSNNGSYANGSNVTFRATAVDSEDGNVAKNLVWRMGDTIIGTGAAFTTRTLPSGTLTITASVPDKEGQIGSASVQIKVALPTITLKSTSNKTSYTNGEAAMFTITTSTSTGEPLAGCDFSVVVATPKGIGYRSETTAGSTQGTVTAQYTFNTTRDGAGTYKVYVFAYKNGYAQANRQMNVTVR